MERLTKRISNPEGKNIIVYTMGDYEDTTVGEMTSSDVRTVLRALANYEDLKDQGLIPKLKVGDKIWTTIYRDPADFLTTKLLKRPEERKIHAITICRKGILYHVKEETYSQDSIGSYIFFTQVEAEEALKRMERQVAK